MKPVRIPLSTDLREIAKAADTMLGNMLVWTGPRPVILHDETHTPRTAGGRFAVVTRLDRPGMAPVERVKDVCMRVHRDPHTIAIATATAVSRMWIAFAQKESRQ
ncbi:hypothetical protein [Salipiger sp.]|uniref:hypothetical protein n=1 Tax=Salipiger sp. TaxID=2078585 RepID=UPI003A988385